LRPRFPLRARLLLLLLACLALLSAPAPAQDEADDGAAGLPSLNLHLPDPENQGNDRAVQPLPVAPAGPRALDFALQYYDYCRAHADPLLSSDTAGAACACKSAQVKNHFTAAQIKGLMGAPGGEKPDNKTVIDVVEAPCLEFAARQYAFNQCYSSSGIRFTMQTENQLRFMCGCIGERIADYFHEFAGYQLDAILVGTPALADPLAEIMSSSPYRSEYEKARTSCGKKAQSLRLAPGALAPAFRPK
jgi:hypothetical protein